MMKRTLSAALLVLSGCFLSAEEKNVLPTVKWNVVKAGGSGGSVEKAGDGTVRLTRTGNQGSFWFYNGGHEYPVKPGKVYRIAAVYKSGVDGTIMLQVMGVKRTPFPIGRGKNGIAEAGFMARPGENKVRIHFSIPQGEALLEKIIVDEMEPPENIIKNPAVYWRASDLGGAKSTMEKIAGKYRIDKTADAGFTAFVPAADLDIVPGKNYLVKITVQRTESSVKYNLMFQMPGGKRTPFPTVNSIGTIGKPETLTYSFTAREDEKKLRPHVMIRNARAAGCEIMRCGAAFAEFWKAEDLFDFSSIDRRLETIDFNAPGTKVILNVNAAMPQWWLKGNPDDMTAYFGGRPPHRQKDRQALASKKWLKDARVGLRGLIRHLQQSPYADRIIGIALSEGWNSEWFWSYTDDHQKSAMAGFSPADYATFRSYLKERYRMDEALRKAWNMPDVTLEKAPMPTGQQWKAGRVGILLDPQKDMQLIDWFRFRNRSIGEAITTLARYVKEESHGKWMVGAYYGYLLAFSNIYNRLQTVGHLDIERVARSLHVDFLTAPSFYTWRRSGQSDAIMQAAESFTAHGKLIIVEQDLRTFGETSSYEIRNGMLSTPEQSVGGLDRAIALSMTRGVGTHWLEMYENWFREPLLIQVMKEGKQAYEALGPVKGTTPVEVALVSDPESAMFIQLNAGNGLHVASIGEMQRRFAEAAVPFRQVLLRDLLEEKVVPPNKFYIVNNLVMLTESDRQALMERFKREKATVLWLYAAGVDTSDAGPSAEMMSDFLGIKFEMKNVVNRPVLKLKPGFRVKEAVNFNTTNPWFIPVSGFDEVLGTLSDGSPGLVKWQKDGVTHYFSTLMNLPPSLIQVLAERANVHVYAKGGDPVLAGNDVVALHAKSSGAKRILLPPSCRMRAVLGPIKGEFSSGEVFEAKSGQTYVFQVYKSK